MFKKISVLALAAMLGMPAMASAGAADLQAQIDSLTRQLEEVKERMEDQTDELKERSEKWDLASRIQFSGDIRSRLDYHSTDTVAFYSAIEAAKGLEWFTNPATADPTAGTIANDIHTVSGSIGETSGSTGLLYGFMRNLGFTPAQAAGAAGQTMGTVLYGDPNAVTVAIDAAGNITGVNTGVGGATLLDQVSRMENLAAVMRTFTPGQRASLFASMGYNPTPAAEYNNDTLWTTRLRLNMRAKATENVEVKARLVEYKTWGRQNTATPEVNENGVHDASSPYFLNSRSFDGTSTRQPEDNILRVDRAFVNWNNIADLPIWFSVGRRPTTDGPPAHLRLGADKRMATPVAFMDYPFDGISMGYAYNNLFGMKDTPGRIRICYGRGFEAGPQQKDTGIDDVDFAGLSWDIYKKGNRFINIQSFGAYGIFNIPGDTVYQNPLELAIANQGLADGSLYKDVATGTYNSSADGSQVLNNTYLDRQNMGNIFHTSGVYMDKYQNLNYFLSLGWSRAEAKAVDELGASLLGDLWSAPETKDGYAIYLGGRYDIPNSRFKIGAEYNYGSKNWLGFTPAHDDQYASKLYTRGSVYEVYGIYDIPAGEAISKYGKAFVRLGYQHYDYDYTYSGMWLGTPNKIDDIKNDPLMAQFYPVFETMDNVYLTLEAFF